MLQAARIRHLACDRRGEKADALKDRRWHIRHVARDHHDCHRLADGAPHAEHDRRSNAALRRRDGDAEIRLDLSRTEGKRGVLIFMRNGLERRDAHLDDRRQDHDGQHDDGRKQACAIRQVERLADGRHEHQHTDKAVHDRRDPREQADGGLQHGADLLGRDLGEVHRRQKTDGHAEDDRACRAVNTR